MDSGLALRAPRNDCKPIFNPTLSDLPHDSPRLGE
ncbi:hypothetical protein M2427_001965 [Bradyrhizobium sp. BR13661]|nr:hypothetical protein [Bradyrhizobium sp. BR13661]